MHEKTISYLIQSVCNNPICDLACHISSCSSVVKHPTSVWKVTGAQIFSEFITSVCILYNNYIKNNYVPLIVVDVGAE